MDSKLDAVHTSGPCTRIGIASCLLWKSVRYDSAQQRNRYITHDLCRFLEFVLTFPEVVIGLGVPRPPVRLRGDAEDPRAVGVTDSTVDVTDKLNDEARIWEETAGAFSGYLFKRVHPSCGMERVKVFDSSVDHEFYLQPHSEELQLRNFV